MGYTPGPKAIQQRALRERAYEEQRARERQQRLLPDPARMEAAKAALAAPTAKPKPARRKK